MNIKSNTNINATTFEYLSRGTVFKCLDVKDDNLYMRIKDIEIKKDDYFSYTINAITLDDGKPMCFLDCTTVMVIDGEFVYHE